MRTLRVTGKGNLKIHPDLTRITITVTGKNKDYAETLKNSSETTEKLKTLFAQFGFKHSDLKTLRFDVDVEYEDYRENNEYKRRFAGYRYNHTTKIEFDSDNGLLGKLLYALANSNLNPEFNISYTVKDQEASKNELLSKAVKDAKEKAEVLAKASGVALKEIQSLDYSKGEISMEFSPVRLEAPRMAKMNTAGSFDIDVEPDDISVSDTVTLIWEIE